MKRLVLVFAALVLAAPASAEFKWSSVRIGGGGYVTGLIVDPASPNRIYARTDVGGLYAIDRGASEWQPLTDAIPRARRGDFSIDSAAIDPTNPQILYAAAGMYTADWWPSPGSILKSTDGGRSWLPPVRLARPDGSVVKFGGNEPKRWCGERIAVNPFSPQMVLVGTRHDGLFQSTDAGASFTDLETPFKPFNQIGITSILFDRKNKDCVAVAAYGDAVYLSKDAGRSWRRTEAGPANVNRLTQARDGTLWAACTSEPRGQGVFKYNYNTSAWTNVTPPGDWPTNYSAVAIDPTDDRRVLVATGEADYLKLFRSGDAGSHWIEIKRTTKSTVPWLTDFMHRIPWTADLKFDPTDPKRVYLTDWYGVWTTADVTAPTAEFTNLMAGLESLVIFDVCALPGGTLLTGCGDLGGFRHTNFSTSIWPNRLPDPPKQYWQDTYSIDYCRAEPQRVVRVGAKRDAGEGFWLNVSNDGGLTWSTPVASGLPAGRHSRVAVSSTDPETFVILNDNLPASVTHDGGRSFKAIDAARLPPASFGPWYTGRPIAADPRNGKRFYVIHADGRVWVSEDAGDTWTGGTPTGGPGAVGPEIVTMPHVIRPSLARDNRVYVANDLAGLFVSDDVGKSFRRVDGITRAGAVAVGPLAGKGEAIYVWGLIHRDEGIFQSNDDGKSWKRISTLQNRHALTHVLETDPQRPDRVFVGTSGRGVFAGEVAP